MIVPKSLKPGDKIGIVAPGRKIGPEQIDAAVQTFSSWQLKVALSPNLFANDHGYLAGRDEGRLSDFQNMIDDPEISAIVCARGGYGTTRILDRLDFQHLLKYPKWIVGFSDITALHLRLNVLGIQSIHSTMPVLFSQDDSKLSIASLRQSLFGSGQLISAPSNTNNKLGSATGEIIGGNLSLLVDSLLTSADADFVDKILIVEEIDEYIYKIDRMFTHLLRAGKLSRLQGLAVGYFSDVKDSAPGFGETVEQVILDKVSRYKFPVAFNLPIGHENPNLAWRSGSTMTLTVNSSGSSFSPEIA
ncbi:MAG TPA: LD-carboxypeptidase [Chryseolinea sp.]|nr:LD-carboxypeptidase [Chryseolinea sp.]